MNHQLFDDQYIVVTGGAGMIGSGVIKHLNDSGYDNIVVVDDIHETTKWKNLRNKRYYHILSRHELFDWLEGKENEIEAFVHLGACSWTTVTDGDYMMSTNYSYSVKLAEYALKHSIRFIYASSAATYGSGVNGFVDNESDIDLLTPMNLYGFSKQTFDTWCLRQGVQNQVLGLKYFNVFGPNEEHKGRMRSLVSKLYAEIKETGKAKLFASHHPDYQDGGQLRDFVYLKDAVAMTCEMLEQDVTGLMNVGTGKPRSWNDLANATFTAMGVPAKIEYVPIPEDLKKSYQNYTCADMTKYNEWRSRMDLPPFPMHTLEEAVLDYVKNHLNIDHSW